MSDQQDILQKTICTCIGVDIIKGALSQLGSVAQVDKSRSTIACYEALNKQINKSKQQKEKV